MRKHFLRFNSFALTAICLALFTCNASAAPKKVVLTWTAPAAQTGINLTGYKLYRGTAANGEGSTAYVTINSASTLTFTDNAVTPGVSYFYKVTATATCDVAVYDCTSFANESVPSNEASTGPIPLPTAPAIGAPTAASATIQ